MCANNFHDSSSLCRASSSIGLILWMFDIAKCLIPLDGQKMNFYTAWAFRRSLPLVLESHPYRGIMFLVE
uniref:Uncharacterized protein n=1 Tax=Ditylenchus dipsaci TaxID=166011 RepID=A0A915DHM5_9BILA